MFERGDEEGKGLLTKGINDQRVGGIDARGEDSKTATFTWAVGQAARARDGGGVCNMSRPRLH